MNSDMDLPTPDPGDRGAWFPAVGVRRGGIAVAAAVAALGLVLLWQARGLDAGGLSLPGPGFIPLVLSGLAVVLAAVIGVLEWRHGDRAGTVALGHRDVVVVFVAMLAIPPLFERLGAYVTLGLFVAVLLVLVARTPVVVAVAAAALAMAACWYFFGVALGLELPLGTLVEGLR